MIHQVEIACLSKNPPVIPPSARDFIWVSMKGVRAPCSGVNMPEFDVMSVEVYPE